LSLINSTFFKEIKGKIVSPFQKELNLKLGNSNFFLMYFRLILSGRKQNQTKEENAKIMLDNLSI